MINCQMSYYHSQHVYRALNFLNVFWDCLSRNGKKFKSIKDCLASSGSSSPIMERASLSLSAVKSLVLRDKEDRLASDLGDDEKVLSLIRSLFDAGRSIH